MLSRVTLLLPKDGFYCHSSSTTASVKGRKYLKAYASYFENEPWFYATITLEFARTQEESYTSFSLKMTTRKNEYHLFARFTSAYT